MDRASVHTGNASEQFLHHNRTPGGGEGVNDTP